jgi:hypothetical protein
MSIEVDAIEDIEDVEVVDVNKDTDDDSISTWLSAVAPSSPTFSVLTDEGSLPPTSDASAEFAEEVDDGDGEIREWSVLKRKCPEEPGMAIKSHWKVVRREEVVTMSDDESGAETNDDGKWSRSAIASRRLRELAKSGEFVADERKRKRFEEKCAEIDRGAKFDYRDASWQVLHSNCSRWYRMSEPYNTTKFKSHTRTCKAKGKDRNTSITTFFKPRDPNDAEAKTKDHRLGAEANFRRWQYFDSTSSTKPPHSDNELVAQAQPCRGISDTHNPLVSTYVSWTVVNGAGSISLQKATDRLYGDHVKYSELTDEQKATVTLTQSHFRSWTINRKHRVALGARGNLPSGSIVSSL